MFKHQTLQWFKETQFLNGFNNTLLKGKVKEIHDLQKLLQMPMMILLFYIYLPFKKI